MESATPDRTFCGPNISYVLASQSYLRDFTTDLIIYQNTPNNVISEIHRPN